MDRILVGAALASLTVVGVDISPTQVTKEVNTYERSYSSFSACQDQVLYLKERYNISQFKCVPDG